MLITSVYSWENLHGTARLYQHLGTGGQLWREFVLSYAFTNLSVVRSALSRFQQCDWTCLCVLPGFPRLREMASLEFPPRNLSAASAMSRSVLWLCRAGTAWQYPCFCHKGHISTWNGHGTGLLMYKYENSENKYFWLIHCISFWHPWAGL